MSNSIFIFFMALIVFGLYLSLKNKWKKRESELNEFTYEMQREFAEKTADLNKAEDYYTTVQEFYKAAGYSLSTLPDFPNDLLAKKDKTILIVRIQTPLDKKDITAKVLHEFIGQTAFYIMDNPLYNNYEVSWIYACSKMKCEQSARIFIKKHENRIKFELIASV